MDRPIVITGAMDCEISELCAALEEKKETLCRGYVFTEGRLYGYPAVIGRTEVGAVNAALCTALLIEKYNPLCVINQGTAGAHLEELSAGDLVLGAELKDINTFHMRREDSKKLSELIGSPMEELLSAESSAKLLAAAERTVYTGGRKTTGIIGSGEFWSVDAEEIFRIRERFGTSCEEMESFASAKVCRRCGTDFLGIRVISNNSLTAQTDFCGDTALLCQHFVLDTVKTILAERDA